MLLTPAVIALLGDADPATRIRHRSTLRQHDLRFTQLSDNLFRLCERKAGQKSELRVTKSLLRSNKQERHILLAECWQEFGWEGCKRREFMRVDDPSIAALMARSQQGDSAAHEAVLRFCLTWLTRYFSGKIHADHVQDLVQETLISIHSKSASYDPTRPFLPWLAAIARYRWIDRLRKVYRAEVTVTEVEPEAIDPEDGVAASISIERMLQMLSDKQQAAITLVCSPSAPMRQIFGIEQRRVLVSS
jgi:RNA polymerase sigma-70 factor (ECF subfamily)